jgi:hypothetical protein
MQTQIETSRRWGYLTEEEAERADSQIGKVVRLLNGLMNALVRKLEGR